MPVLPDSNLSTLTQIRTKVRRLTRSPSINQISNAEIDSYVNTFILYDMPEHLKLASLLTTFTFYTSPFIDTYATNTTLVDDPLYNFKNKYIVPQRPVLIAGYPAMLTQSREQFFNVYPLVNSISSNNVFGDGVTTTFTGFVGGVQGSLINVNRAILRNNVTFSSVDVNNNGLVLKDDGAGNLLTPNTTVTVPASTINYITGAFSVTFLTAPKSGQPVNSQTVAYVPSRPQAVLFFEDEFTVRPVPDQPYRVDIDVYRRPTELLATTDSPELAEWWQYIAYGASKKVFEDRADPDSVQLIMAEFKTQESLCRRRTIVQQTLERTSTIYTEQTGLNGTSMGGGWGGTNF